MANKNLTPMQEAFLDALTSEECYGDVRAAMTKAGYARTANVHALVKSLRKEILEIAEEHLAANALKAAMGLTGSIDDATGSDRKERMRAMEQVLDRAGVIKQDGLRIGEGQQAAIFILPAKQRGDDE